MMCMHTVSLANSLENSLLMQYKLANGGRFPLRKLLMIIARILPCDIITLRHIAVENTTCRARGMSAVQYIAWSQRNWKSQSDKGTYHIGYLWYHIYTVPALRTPSSFLHTRMSSSAISTSTSRAVNNSLNLLSILTFGSQLYAFIMLLRFVFCLSCVSS